jgi:hypothetical protein
MSQFNNPFPNQPMGQKPLPMGAPYEPGPQRPASGSNVILIVLGIVFGILVLIVLVCGALGFVATRAVSTIGQELEGMIIQPMANEAVQRYQDHESVQEHIGEIKDYRFENPAIDVVNRPVLRLEVEGEKGKGTIVFYRRAGKTQKVMLEVDGQEVLLDDNPEELFAPDFDEATFDEMTKESETLDEIDPFPSQADDPGSPPTNDPGSPGTNDPSVPTDGP